MCTCFNAWTVLQWPVCNPETPRVTILSCYSNEATRLLASSPEGCHQNRVVLTESTDMHQEVVDVRGELTGTASVSTDEVGLPPRTAAIAMDFHKVRVLCCLPEDGHFWEPHIAEDCAGSTRISRHTYSNV